MRDADCSAGRALPRSCGRSGGDGRGYTGRRGWLAGRQAGRRGQWRRPRCAAREGGRTAGRSRSRGGGGPGVASASQVSRTGSHRASHTPSRAGCLHPAAGRGGVTCCGAEPPAERGVSGAAEAARGHIVGGGSRTAAQSARSGRNSFAAWASAGS